MYVLAIFNVNITKILILFYFTKYKYNLFNNTNKNFPNNFYFNSANYIKN